MHLSIASIEILLILNMITFITWAYRDFAYFKNLKEIFS